MANAAQASNPEDESPAQRQARLRRERRNAKIQAGGADRLSKITSLNGRPASTTEPIPPRTPPVVLSEQPSSCDPPEVDISTSFTPTQMEEPGLAQQQAILRQMLRQESETHNTTEPSDADDPMMAMLQQLMGQGAQSVRSGDGVTDGSSMPSGLADMLSRSSPAENTAATNLDYVWRIVHAIFATSVAVYAASSLAFAGSPFSREYSSTQDLASRIFWTFATGQLLLQSARYALEGGKPPPGSLMQTIASFLPLPYANYIRVASRYSIIYTAILGDALLVIFVLGSMAWLNGHATA